MNVCAISLSLSFFLKASDFIKHIGGAESLYGIHDDTLDSLLLSLLPPVGFQEFLETDKPQKEEQVPTDVKPEVFLVRRLLRALRKRAGFRLPHVSCYNTFTRQSSVRVQLIFKSIV